MKKILPLLICSFLATQAQVIDAIAIDVEGEPITSLEIQAVQEKLGMSKQAAVETLIKDRLEIAAIKKAGIQIPSEAIEAKINAIASAKGLTQAKMREILFSKRVNMGELQRATKNRDEKRAFLSRGYSLNH